MTADVTESFRRKRVVELNDHPETRASLELQYGQVWDTDQLQRDFVVTSFAAPFVVVTRRSDGQKGSLEFTHQPRFYFNLKVAS